MRKGRVEIGGMSYDQKMDGCCASKGGEDLHLQRVSGCTPGSMGVVGNCDLVLSVASDQFLITRQRPTEFLNRPPWRPGTADQLLIRSTTSDRLLEHSTTIDTILTLVHLPT